MPDAARRRDAAVGALLGALVGDAFGLPYEGAPPARAGEDRLSVVERAQALRYSDDTQLTLALAEHLLACPSVDPVAFGATILEHYEDWRGYAPGMQRLVDVWQRDGVSLAAATSVFPDGSFGNGAAMRVAPVGIRWAGDDAMLAAAAERSARITHAHPLGIEGAILQARAVALAATRGRFGVDEVHDVAAAARAEVYRERLSAAAELAAGDADAATVTARIGADVTAHASVPAAMWVATAPTLRAVLDRALTLGGDTDTIAAMAAAVRGAADGPGCVEDGWVARLERGPRGLDALVAVAERLATGASW